MVYTGGDRSVGLHEARRNQSRHVDDGFAESDCCIDLRIDLGPLRLDRWTEDSFDDLIARRTWRSEPLYSLARLRLQKKAGAAVRILNTYGGDCSDPTYMRNLDLLLTKAGFHELRTKPTPQGRLVECSRRPLVEEVCEHDMVIREVADPHEIETIHEFAREYYYYKDFNYDLDVVRQFDPNSDVLAVFEPNGTILSIVRSTVRVPGYNVPFMYARQADGRHVEVPENHHRICEIMALYREGKRGIIAFKRLIEYLTQYLYYVARVDSVWTTYDKSDTFTGTYYKNKFLMEDVDVTLVYRDFGGLWQLICSDRIEEGKNLYHRLFRR